MEVQGGGDNDLEDSISWNEIQHCNPSPLHQLGRIGGSIKQMSARETKYESGKFPNQDVTSSWSYFYRKKNDQLKPLPYFYDVERTTKHAVTTYHGKPGQYLWKNKTKFFSDKQSALKQVGVYIKGRANFNGGKFIRCQESCRFGFLDESNISKSISGTKRKAVIDLSLDSDQDDDEVVHVPIASSSSSSSSFLPASKKSKKKSKKSKQGPSTSNPMPNHYTADDVLKMPANTLHLCFPFTNALKFDPNRIWADPDHQTLTKPCFKAGRNLFGPSIIEGHNPKKNKPNYWCTGMKDGTIIPYNLKLKLGMTLKGRPNHQCTGQEKARVAAMYRECELRGIGFKKPK